MIPYPESFPCASRIEGHGADIGAGLVRTPMGAGNTRQRRSHEALPHTISLVFVIKQTLWQGWLAWANAHAWNEWVLLELPGLRAAREGVPVTLVPVRFCSDLQKELLAVHRLWYWRVSVQCEYMPDPADLEVGAWIIGGTPPAPSASWVIAGTPTSPSIVWTEPGMPAAPVVFI